MVSFSTLHQPLLIPFLELISLVFELLLDTLQVCLHHIHLLLHFFFFLFGLFEIVFLLELQLLLFGLLLHKVTLPDSEGFVVVQFVESLDVRLLLTQLADVGDFHLIVY